MLKHTRVTIRPNGDGQVILDGQDVSHGVRSLSVVSAVGCTPVLTLTLLTGETIIDGHLAVHLDPHAAKILQMVGWTPPAADQ